MLWVWPFVVMNLTLSGINYKISVCDLDLEVIAMGGGDDDENFGPVSIIIPNTNQIYHMVWKI